MGDPPDVDPGYVNDLIDEVDLTVSITKTCQPSDILTTPAGRGYSGYQAALTPIKKSNYVSNSSGRAGVISTQKIGENPVNHHLRQATGAGYSNALIEEAFGNKNKEGGQFEDADALQEIPSSIENTLAPMFLEKTNLSATPQVAAPKLPEKSVAGTKKKKRGTFHKFCPEAVEDPSLMSDVDRCRLPKKTLTEVFRTRPDYEKSYNSQRTDPLGSKNFPSLK